MDKKKCFNKTLVMVRPPTGAKFVKQNAFERVENHVSDEET